MSNNNAINHVIDQLLDELAVCNEADEPELRRRWEEHTGNMPGVKFMTDAQSLDLMEAYFRGRDAASLLTSSMSGQRYRLANEVSG